VITGDLSVATTVGEPASVYGAVAAGILYVAAEALSALDVVRQTSPLTNGSLGAAPGAAIVCVAGESSRSSPGASSAQLAAW